MSLLFISDIIPSGLKRDPTIFFSLSLGCSTFIKAPQFVRQHACLSLVGLKKKRTYQEASSGGAANHPVSILVLSSAVSPPECGVRTHTQTHTGRLLPPPKDVYSWDHQESLVQLYNKSRETQAHTHTLKHVHTHALAAHTTTDMDV